MLPHEWFDVFGAFGFINLCLNPVIYAARYEMFKKSLARMLKRDNYPVGARTVASSTV